MLEKGLPAIAPANARLFILGSLPGTRSLEERRYYAHPTNQFWRLVGSAIGRELQPLDYDQRLAVLQDHRIGLWDVIDSAQREGSADHRIRGASSNDLDRLVQDFPDLRAIFFNGARAGRDGRRLLKPANDLSLFTLPSSSAAHARPFAEKVAAWARIGDFASCA